MMNAALLTYSIFSSRKHAVSHANTGCPNVALSNSKVISLFMNCTGIFITKAIQ